MKRNAFALLEVLVVVGIVGIVGMFATPLIQQMKFRNDLELSKTQIIQGLQRARANAMAGKNDSNWSFYVPQGVLFAGTTYDSSVADSSTSEVYPMPSSVRMTGLTQVTYDRQGNPSQTGTISLAAYDGGVDTIQVVLSVALGSVDTTTGGNLTICYNGSTISVTDAAWPSYQSRGATAGGCAGASSSATSSSSVASSSSSTPASSSSSTPASSSSSSVASSSSSSSSTGLPPGSGGMGSTTTCPTKFTLQTDNVIKTNTAVTVAFTNIAALRQYGTNGPYMDTHYCYSTNNGSSFTKMFSGNGNCTGNGNAYGNAVNINGGDTSGNISVATNKYIVVKVRWKYQTQGWLATNDIFDSKDDTSRFVYMRDGDNPTSNAGYWSQPDLKSLLQTKGLLDAQGKVNIGACELLLTTEGGTLWSGADYNDAVMKLTFN